MKSINSIIFIFFLLFVAQCALLKHPNKLTKGDRHGKGHRYYDTEAQKPETKVEEEVFPTPTEKIVTAEGTIHTDGIKEEKAEESSQEEEKPTITRKQYEKLYNISTDDEEEEEKPQTVATSYNFLLTEEKYRTFIKLLKDLRYQLLDENYPKEKIFDALEAIERNFDDLDQLESYTLKEIPEEESINYTGEEPLTQEDVLPEDEGFINNTGIISHPEYIANQEKEPEDVDDEEEEEEEPKEEEDEEEEKEEEKEEEEVSPVAPEEEAPKEEETTPVAQEEVNPEEVAPVYPEVEESKEVQKEEVNQPADVKEEETTEVAPIAQATKSDQVQMENVAEAEPVPVTKES